MGREDEDIEAFLDAVTPIIDGIKGLGDIVLEIIEGGIEDMRHLASVCRGMVLFVLRRWRRK